MRAVFGLALLLAACGGSETVADTPGERLEDSAVARGVIADPDKAVLAGLWSSEADRICILSDRRPAVIGISTALGDGNGCVGRGTVERRGDTLKIAMGACRFDARFDGERIAMPAELPAACERLCAGRASLSALTVERLSESASEAATLRGSDGAVLCGASSS